MPANLRLALGAAAGAGNTSQAMPATLQPYELLPVREELVAPQPLRATLLALTPALVVAVLGATGAASAYGILVVGELVGGTSSPYFRPTLAGELPDASTEALAALDASR